MNQKEENDKSDDDDFSEESAEKEEKNNNETNHLAVNKNNINLLKMLKLGDDRKVPPLLKKIHPWLKNFNYDKLKHTHEFALKKVAVCEICFVHISQYMEGSGENMKDKLLPQIEIKPTLNFRPTHSRTVGFFDI